MIRRIGSLRHSVPLSSVPLLIGSQRLSALLITLVFVMFLGFAAHYSTQEPDIGAEFAYDSARQAWVVTEVTAFGVASAAGVQVGDAVALLDGLPPAADTPINTSGTSWLELTRLQTDQHNVIEQFGQESNGPSPWPFFVIGSLFFLVGVGGDAFSVSKIFFVEIIGLPI